MASRPSAVTSRLRHAQPAAGLAVPSKEVRQAVEQLAAGGLVVLLDTISGTTAGYIVAAAGAVTPELMTVIVREGRPLLALTDDRCRALGLRQLRSSNPSMSQHLETIEAREGVTTGISAADQAHTIRTAVDPAGGPRDLVRPGHVVTVGVSPGGILHRLGTYEAAVELAEQAGHHGGAVMCAMLSEDGEVLATPALVSAWAADRSLPVVTTLDALDARMARERFVVAEQEHELESPSGAVRAVTFADHHANVRHYALVAGSVDGAAPVALHILEQDPLGDVFGADRSQVLEPLAGLLADPPGAVLYIAPAPLAGAPSDDPSERARSSLLAAKRQAHVSSQILKALDVRTVRRPEPGAG
jgi:3,4-dihydroxy 2-butanone 4-phosphate synthase/GTP cyclohydrolase II